MRYCLEDIAIETAPVSSINHRKTDCDPYLENGRTCLYTSCMLNVIDHATMRTYIDNGINPILPRTEPLDTRLEVCLTEWCAFGLDEFITLFADNTELDKATRYVVIDIANGNMIKLINAIIRCKQSNSNVKIMAGNVANPLAFERLAAAGADAVRLSVGTGSVCTTAANTGIFYPMASLIDECYQIKVAHRFNTSIIADGGIKNYDDIMKCLALGANGVMCGSLFNKMLEAAGPMFIRLPKLFGGKYIKVSNGIATYLFKHNVCNVYREYFGMSTKRAQVEMGLAKLHTGEGKSVFNKVSYTMHGWMDNFLDYLRSNMSYIDVREVRDINPETTTVILISTNSYASHNK